MASQQTTQGIQNVWLMVTAAVLGLVVVFLYNAHISAIREEQARNVIAVAQATRTIFPDEKLTIGKNIRKVEIPRTQAIKEGLGDVVLWEHVATMTDKDAKPVNQTIKSGRFIRYAHVTGLSEENVVGLGPGMVGIVVEFDARQSLGDILRPGNLISFKGQFSLDNKPYQHYRIMSNVRVLSVGGRGKSDTRAGNPVSYRQVTVEVSEKVSLQWSNLKTHMGGDLQLELCPYMNTPPPGAGEINPILEPLYRRANPAAGGGGIDDYITEPGL
jgi:Flp pilus assembly protein CpaB